MLTIDHKFSSSITFCKAIGIGALFIAWYMYPPSSADTAPRREDVMEVAGELRKVAGHNKGVYALDLQTSEFDGKAESRNFKWVTAVDDRLIGQFQPGRQLQMVIPRARPVFSVGKPHSWAFRIDGVTLMTLSEGVKMRQTEIRTLKQRASNIFVFGVALLACTLAANYRFGQKESLREAVGAVQGERPNC